MSSEKPGREATIAANATGQSSLKPKPGGSGFLATMIGQVCVTNLGPDATENLTLVNKVQVRFGREPYVDVPGAELVIHPADLAAGETRCFPVEIVFEPRENLSDYRYLAVATITDAPAHPGVPFGVQATACCKPTPPPPTPPPPPPPPFEIDCILVDKVYDFCFEEDTGLQHCVPIPASCGIPPAGSTATCTIVAVQCTTGSPIPTGVDGLSTVRVTVTVAYDTVIRNAAGVVICTIVGSVFTFTKTVTVCGPLGTTADCEVRAATCGPCTILPPIDPVDPPAPAPLVFLDGGLVCCEFNFCVLVETTAPVKLLVPVLGFCTPARCQTGGFPPGVCPPSPLFPPQCTPVAG